MGGHGAGGFEFAAFLAEEERAVGIEDGKGRDAAVERNFIFLGDVEIFVVVADVDMDDEVELVQKGRDFGTVKGFVENVAIEAPVTAKDDEDALAGRGGGFESRGNFFGGVGIGGIDVFVGERLTETRGRGTLGNADDPVIAVQEPGLDHGDVGVLAGFAGSCGEGELGDDDVDAGAGVFVLDDLGRERDEAVGFPACPKIEFVLERDWRFTCAEKLRGLGTAVKSGNGAGIADKDGGAPFLERAKLGCGDGFLRGGGGCGGGEEKSDEKEW